ncbi:MAG: SgcJ/EcaC family oxidoreductase [Myxococcota bacterium]
MSRSLLLMASILAAWPALAQEEAETPEPAPPAIRGVVEAGNYLFQRAFEDRDARALADLYTEDGRVIPPGGAPVDGRAAIAAFWAEQMKATARVRLETLDVEADGDLAAEHGVARLIAPDGSETAIQYIVVWKRVGRRWHLHRDIWNAAPADVPEPAPSDEPAPPDAAATSDEGAPGETPGAETEPVP